MVAVSALAAYVPIDRLQALARGDTLPDRTTGAALFADVSGFSELTGTLTHEMGSRRGAEELLNYLNPVFDAMIAELHRFGGVVISFAGDSITCWFERDDGRCATACALAMQEVMKPYHSQETAAGTPFSLQVKIAISAGPARRFAVGSPDVQVIDVLAGHTLTRMAAGEKLALKGETVVGAPVLRVLADRITVDDVREDDSGFRIGVVTATDQCAPPEPPSTWALRALSEDQVRSWLLPPIRARIESEQTFLAELRPAAVLFVRFSGLDYDADDKAGDKLDAYVRWVQEVVSRHHGFLLQLSVGDKGSYMYMTFGAPVAYGNNAILASATALDLATGSAQFDGIKEVRLGLSAGRMWTGAYGAANRCTYGVLGNEVNMAARLMANAAPAQILVSEQVVKAAGEHYRFRDLGSISVRGRVQPLPIHELASRRRSTSGGWGQLTDPLVGRQEELAELERILAESVEGRGQVVSLLGEAGIGKSHLAVHASREAVGNGAKLAVGVCESVTQSTPYSPWRQIFRTLLDIAGALEEEPADDLATRLAERYPQWTLRLPVLGDLLGLLIPDNPTTASLDASMRQKALFSLAIEMVQMWARNGPLLLVVENAHWMDEASASLLHALAQQGVRGAPVLLMLVHRPAMPGNNPLLPELKDSEYYSQIRLRGLSPRHLQGLVRQQIDGRPSALLSSLILTMTRGNPFYAGELINAMRRDAKLVQQADGTWQVSSELLARLQAADLVQQVKGRWDLRPEADLSTVRLGMPDSVHGVILSQVDRLPEGHKLTLKICSVIGHHFSLDLVSEARPQWKDQPQIQKELDLLEAERIVHQEDPISRTYAFRHRTTQEVVYRTLLHAQRRQLHRIVAHALAGKRPRVATQIAHHAYLGETWSLSLQYCLLAGEEAKQIYANQQSIAFFEKALRSARELPETDTTVQRNTLHLALGELLVSIGRYEVAYEHLEQTLLLAQELGDCLAQARAYRWFGRAHELRGEYEQALRMLDKGFDLVGCQQSPEEAELALIAGLINIRQGAYERALELCKRSLDVAERLDDASVRARTFNLMGIVDRRCGRSDSALDRFQQSLAQYERLGDVYGQATSHNLIANGYYMQGRWKLADDHYHRSLEIFTQIGDSYHQVLASNNLGGIALKQGRLNEALEHYQHAISLLEQTGGSLWLTAALHMNLGNALLQRQDPEAAGRQLQLAHDLFKEATVRDLLPELFGLLAEVALLRGDILEAEKMGQRSVELARELDMPCEEGHNLRILGEIAQADGRFEQAETHYVDSYAILKEVGDTYECAKTQLSLAELCSLQGSIENAEAALATCERTFSLLDAGLDLERVEEARRRLRQAKG